jgi:hypothetical protein
MLQITNEQENKIIEAIKPYMYCYFGSGTLTNDYDEKVATDNAKGCLQTVLKELDTLSPSLRWVKASERMPKRGVDINFRFITHPKDVYTGRIYENGFYKKQDNRMFGPVYGQDWNNKIEWLEAAREQKIEMVDALFENQQMRKVLSQITGLPHYSNVDDFEAATKTEASDAVELGKEVEHIMVQARGIDFNNDDEFFEFIGDKVNEYLGNPQKTEAKTSCNSYQHIEVENFIKNTITETAAAMLVWIKEDTIIRDRHGAIIPYAEIDVREHPKSLVSRVYKNLEKHGIKLLNDEQNPEPSVATDADSNSGPDNQITS